MALGTKYVFGSKHNSPIKISDLRARRSFLYVLVFLLLSAWSPPSQKRLEQKSGSVTATPAGTPAAPAATPKVIVGSISGQGTPTAKVVLSTKMGSPVTFQQNKNFQQSFATWVKQGQSTQGNSEEKNSLFINVLDRFEHCAFLNSQDQAARPLSPLLVGILYTSPGPRPAEKS